MNAPAREPGGHRPIDGGRQSEPNQNHAGRNLNNPSASAGTEPPPPWKQQPRRAFAGDVAMAGMRVELAQMPDGVPEPPIPNSRTFGARGLIAVVTAAAAGAVAYLWSSAPEPNALGHLDVASAARELPTSL